MAEQVNKSFLGTGWSFPPSFNHHNSTFSGKIWHALGRCLWAQQFDSMLDFWQQLLRRLNGAALRTDSMPLNRHFFTHLFHLASVTDRGSFDPVNLADSLIRLIAEQEGIPIAILWEHLGTAPPGPTPGQDRITPILPALMQRRNQVAPESIAKKEPPKREPMLALMEEALLVPNAGLVILATYLPRYFGTLNLLENQQFKDAAAAERAVHLLQYLASYQTESPEHMLVFNKVLCGIPLSTPISLGFEPTTAERELSDFLLNTVLQHWEMMKKSSIKNLQGAFLLREGLLRETEDKWQLNVEKKGYDIVLDYLPWTFSMVKLPWMEKRIDTEWKKTV